MLWPYIYRLASFLPSLLLAWAVSRFLFDSSWSYILECFYLDLKLKLGQAKANAEASAKAAAKGGRSEKDEPGKKEKDEGKVLRGVALRSPEDYSAAGQTLPPTRRVSSLFPHDFPPGEIHLASPSRGGTWPFSRSEVDVEDEAWLHRRKCLREGAETHRQVRQFVQMKLRPGMELRELAEMLEKASSSLIGFDAHQPLARGWAFPTGISLNEVAAHDTVNPGDAPRCLKATDIVKLDFGVHVEGHILDSAFSFTFSDRHEELMRAVKEATEEGLKHAGHDALVSEVGGHIREVMEAAEVHLPTGQVLPVKVIKNLTGHLIAPYRIHAGKPMPQVNSGSRARMLAGELWAIETFGSVGGVGYVSNAPGCSHFMRSSSQPPSRLQQAGLSKNALQLLELVDQRFGTLAFCPRWVAQEAQRLKSPFIKGEKKDNRWWSSPLDELCNMGVVNRYPPLADLHGSFTAQYEHTILLGSKSKEILTRGSDY